MNGQSERPETIIIPVSGIGEIPNSRKLILQNKLTNKLKQYFRIVPQEKYEQVLEQVFEELEYEECSEDTCIMRVQEMLQVENVFHLQLIGEGNDIQLNLKWITLDEKKNEEFFCEKCSTKDLYYKLEGMVEKLVVSKELVKKRKIGKLCYDNIDDDINPFGQNLRWFSNDDGDCNMSSPGGEKQYEGEIENGLPNGTGKSTQWWTAGYIEYEGEWKDGKSHGQGTEQLFYQDGRPWSKDKGEWKEGVLWNVTSYDPYGNLYMIYEKGVKTFEKKPVMTLYLRSDKDFDYGWYVDGDADKHQKYVGEIFGVFGNPGGKGTLTLPNGDIYEGEWKDLSHVFGSPIGNEWNATHYDKDGNIKEKWVNGEIVVVEKKKKGVLYERKVNGKWGWYKSGDEKKDMSGKSMSGKYVGEIDKGLPNGQGTFIIDNMYVWEKYVGEWKDGKKWNGTGYYKNGNIETKFANGEKRYVYTSDEPVPEPVPSY